MSKNGKNVLGKAKEIDATIGRIRSEAANPQNDKELHWKTWLMSLKSNNVYGSEFEFNEWVERFSPNDLKNLRLRFETFYRLQNEKT